MILPLAAIMAAQAAASPPAMAGKVEQPTEVDRQMGQPIRGITFVGTEAPTDVARSAERFIGMPNTRRTLAELVAALTDAYASSPVALYSVAIPDQDFADGVVMVALTEAGVETAKVDQATNFPRLNGLAQRMVGEQPLSRKTYERQISLMKAIPGVKFDLTSDNPDLDNDVDMSIKPSRKRVEASLGIGNRGPDLIGDVVGDTWLDFNALAVDGDRLRFSAATTPHPRRFRQLGASYDVPLGLSGLAMSSNLALIRTRAKGLDLEGRARVAQVAVTYPVIRNFHQALDVGVLLDGVNSDNALFGNAISSDRVRTLRALGGFTSARPKSTIKASLVLSHGLDLLGARVNPLISTKTFLKASASGSFDYRFTPRVIGRMSAQGQYSRSRLPASELFAIGGTGVGRAFDTAILSGDRGVGITGEMAFLPLRTGTFAKSEVYGYVDGARAALEGRAGFPAQHYGLASVGGGFRAKWKDKAELGLEIGRVIDKPYPAYEQKWRLSLLYRLTL